MFDKNLMKLPGMGAIMGALAVLALLQAACTMGQAIGLAQAVCVLWDGSGAAAGFAGGSGIGVELAGAQPLEAAVPSIALFAVCFAVLQLVRFAQETMLDRFSVKQAQALRAKVLDRTFDSRSLLSLRVGAARVAHVANDGIDEVQTYLRIIPPKIVGMAVISIPLLVCEFAFDWVSGIILAVMFPVIIFFMILLGRQARERSERQYAVYTRLTNRFMDTLRGLPVLKAFGASDAEAGRVYENSEDVRRATVRTLRTATLSSAVLDLCATFGVGAVAIMLAFRLLDGTLPLYTGLVALILAPEYFTPIRAFASDYHASLDGKNSLSAVLEMVGSPESGEAESEAGVDEPSIAEPQSGASVDEPPIAEPHEVVSVEFRGVSHLYDGGAGLRDVSFSVAAGEKVGVIGKSGAGKSTLAGLFAGFLAPTGGEVLVNGAPADLTSDAWKRMVRYIPQNPYVFRATLADNIRFYRPDATLDEVRAVVRAVGLDDLVADLPQGLDTLVGEGARGLSGGQAHRVTLARIMLDEQARVLVFDEPTAHLDIETERDLKPAMLAAMEGRLVLFATHRLHWMADMDRVVNLEAACVGAEAQTGPGRGQSAGAADGGPEGPAGSAMSPSPAPRRRDGRSHPGEVGA